MGEENVNFCGTVGVGFFESLMKYVFPKQGMARITFLKYIVKTN